MTRVEVVLIAIGGSLLLAGAQSENPGPREFDDLLFKTAWKIETNDTWREAFERLVLKTKDSKPLAVVPFHCKEEGDTLGVPTTVHALRPRDIRIIGALGDSLTAGNAIGARTVLTVLRERRGESWSIGGDKSIEDGVITLPNILKKFNPDIRGYSTGYGTETSANTYLNVAVPGAKAEDLPEEADHLIKKIQDDPSLDMTGDWKIMTVMVGAGDMCNYCKDRERYSPGVYIAHIQETLDKLHMALPRTLVNLVPMMDLVTIPKIRKGWLCDILDWAVCPCATDPLTRDEVSAYHDALYQGLRALVESGRYDTSIDFTVVLQPFLVDIDFPKDADGEYDETYIAPDCFHPDRRAQQAAAYMLWNTMMTPVGEKPLAYPIYDEKIHRFVCPSSNRPYIYTSSNSVPGVKQLPWPHMDLVEPSNPGPVSINRKKRHTSDNGPSQTAKHITKNAKKARNVFADQIRKMKERFDHDVKLLHDGLIFTDLGDLGLDSVNRTFPVNGTSELLETFEGVFSDAKDKAGASLKVWNNTARKADEQIELSGERLRKAQDLFASKAQSINATMEEILKKENKSDNSAGTIAKKVMTETLKPLENVSRLKGTPTSSARHRRDVSIEHRNEANDKRSDTIRILQESLDPKKINEKFLELGKEILGLKKKYEDAMTKARDYVNIRKKLGKKVMSNHSGPASTRAKRNADEDEQHKPPHFTETMDEMHKALDIKTAEKTFNDMWKILYDVQQKMSFGMKKIDDSIDGVRKQNKTTAAIAKPLPRHKRAEPRHTKNTKNPFEMLFNGFSSGLGANWQDIQKVFDPETIKQTLGGLAHRISNAEKRLDSGMKAVGQQNKDVPLDEPVNGSVRDSEGSGERKRTLRPKRAVQKPAELTKYDPKKFDKLMDTIHPEKLDKLHKLTQGIFDQSQKFGDEIKFFGSKMQNPLANVLPPPPVPPPVVIPGIMSPKLVPTPHIEPLKPLPVKPIKLPKPLPVRPIKLPKLLPVKPIKLPKPLPVNPITVLKPPKPLSPVKPVKMITPLKPVPVNPIKLATPLKPVPVKPARISKSKILNKTPRTG